MLYARATELMTSPAFQTANQEAFGKLMSCLGSTNAWDKLRSCVAIYPDAVEVGEEVPPIRRSRSR